MDPKKIRFFKILFWAIVSANAGYTFFLFPLLGYLYPQRIPLNLKNLAAFLLIDTAAGILLSLLIWFFYQKIYFPISLAAGVGIFLLWILYWIPTSLQRLDLRMIGLDAIAALVVWLILILLHDRAK